MRRTITLPTFKTVKKKFHEKNAVVILTDYYERTDYVETRAPSFFLTLVHNKRELCAKAIQRPDYPGKELAVRF